MKDRILAPLDYPEGFDELLRLNNVDTSAIRFFFQVVYENGRKGSIIAFNDDGTITRVHRGMKYIKSVDYMMFELRLWLYNIDEKYLNEKILGIKD